MQLSQQAKSQDIELVVEQQVNDDPSQPLVQSAVRLQAGWAHSQTHWGFTDPHFDVIFSPAFLLGQQEKSAALFHTGSSVQVDK